VWLSCSASEGDAGSDVLVPGIVRLNDAYGVRVDGVGTEDWVTKCRRRLGGDIRAMLRNSGVGRISAGRSDIGGCGDVVTAACRAISRSTIIFGSISICVWNILTLFVWCNYNEWHACTFIALSPLRTF